MVQINSSRLAEPEWLIWTCTMSLKVLSSVPPMSACKYMDQKDVVCKFPAGATPEISLRNPLNAGEKADKGGLYPGFETQSRCQQKSKAEISVAPQKELMSSKDLKKKNSYKVACLCSK